MIAMRMTTAAGIIVNIARDRYEELHEAMACGDVVAEAVPEFHHSRNLPLIAFVSFEDGHITHLAMGRRGNRAATKLSRLNLENILTLSVPISFREILSELPDRVRRYAAEKFLNGGLLTPATFSHVLEAVQSLSRESRQLLDRFSQTRMGRINALTVNEKQSLADQKEAIATAFKIASLDPSELQEWEPPSRGNKVTSYLDGFQSVTLREDAMIAHDMMHIPGFDIIKTMKYASAVFSNEKTKLTITLANRLPLEKQLGVDLIYYNETYESFILVQYKAMDKSSSGEDIFRIPNKLLDEEIQRMDSVLNRIKQLPEKNNKTGFRINSNPFFLKFCPRKQFNPDDKGLVNGMYIPIDYWRLLSVDRNLMGPRKGRVITFDNIGRYMNNTNFANFVSQAWIGTSARQSNILKPIIREILSTGRTVALAVKADIVSRG